MPYGITQCYLPPGRGDIPALTCGVLGEGEVAPPPVPLAGGEGLPPLP